MGTSSLTRSQYKEYFKKVKDLEVACYQLTQLNSQLQQKKQQLERTLRNLALPQPPQKAKVKGYIGAIFLMLFLIIVFSLAGGLAGLIVWLFHSGNGFLDNFIGGGGDEPTDPYVIPGMIIGCGIALICGIYNMFTLNKEYSANMQKFKDRKQKVEHISANNLTTIKNIDSALSKCKNEYTQTSNVLKQYYDLGYIYPKYRGLIPVCTIYEYLDSGRCFTLEGHEGAYNLYESELRMNIVLDKLNEVLYRLDDISSSQHLLANELKASNAQIDYLCHSVDKIGNTSALTQYYSKVSAENSSYLAWMKFLEH
mgnify:CR=1 FL=1